MIKKALLSIIATVLLIPALALAGERNEGITCVKKGSRVTATYDYGNSGTTISKSVIVNYNGGGSYGCMGRCGGGCGSWWKASSYTKDCLDHDQCSLDLNASGGTTDRNCGDEWNHAADDWTFGVIKGCRG